jgi:hypothetical protein
MTGRRERYSAAFKAEVALVAAEQTQRWLCWTTPA